MKSSPFAPARPPLSCWREECSFSRKLKKYRARSFFRFLLGNIKEAGGWRLFCLHALDGACRQQSPFSFEDA